VASRGKLQKVQSVDAAKLDTGKIAECKLNAIILGVYDKRTTTHGVSAVTHLTLTGADLLGVSGLVNVSRAPTAERMSFAAEVFLVDSMEVSKTSGTSGTSSTT